MSVQSLLANAEFVRLAREGKTSLELLVAIPGEGSEPTYRRAAHEARTGEKIHTNRKRDEGARVRRLKPEVERPDLQRVESDKKEGKVSWRELCRAVSETQRLIRDASWSQDEATVSFPDAQEPIAIICLSDLHWGSLSTDHSLIEQLTDDILSVPNLFVIALGDLEHMAIKLRGVVEVADNALPPKVQHEFTESWLEEVGHRIICSTWCNHSVEREEKQSGTSLYARIMSRRVVYHNGIGHINLGVGQQQYKIAASHTFRGRSIENPVHGILRYMRREGIDREIGLAGDSHVPGMLKYTDGNKERLAINCGSTQVQSGFARRYFSLKTWPVFPCFTLDPHEHCFTPYWSLKEYLASGGGR